MKKLFVLFVGLLMAGLVLVPTSKAKAAMTGEFTFSSTTLMRGQDNTINFTVTNTSTQEKEWATVISVATEEALNIEYKAPKDGTTVAGVHSGPYDIYQYTEEGYDGVMWALVDKNKNLIGGREVMSPGESENFSFTIFVPAATPLGELFIGHVLAKVVGDTEKYGEGASSFTVVEPSPVQTLPQTGADATIMILPFLSVLALPLLRKIC